MRSELLRRPLLSLAFAYLLGILSAKHIAALQNSIFFTAVSLFAAVFFFIMLIRKKKELVFLLVLLFTFSFGAFLFGKSIERQPISDEKLIEARVLRKENGVYRLGEVTIDGEMTDHLLWLECDTELLRDDRISFSAELQIPDQAKTKNGFDDRLYASAKGISYRTETDEISVIGKADDIRSKLNTMRSDLGEYIAALYPENAGLAKAILFGIEDDIPRKTYSLYQAAGITHVLVLSGQHITLFAWIVQWLSDKLRLSRTTKLLLITGILLFFSFLTDFSPSTMRAVISGAYAALAEFLGKRRDAMTGLSLAFLILALAHPCLVFHAGFQLSFGISFTLFLISKTLREYPLKYPKLIEFIAIGIGATVASGVLLINISNEINPLALFLNYLIAPIMALLVPLLAVSAAVYAVLGEAAAFLVWLPNLLIHIMNRLAEFFADTEMLLLPDLPPAMLLFFFVFAYLFSKFCRKNNFFKVSLALILSALLIFGNLKTETFELRLRFIGGESVLIETQENTTLIGIGKSDYTQEYLLDNGIFPQNLITHNRLEKAALLYQKNLCKNIFAPEISAKVLQKDWDIPAKSIANHAIMELNSETELIVLSVKGEDETMLLLLRHCGENICLLPLGADLVQFMESIRGNFPVKIAFLPGKNAEKDAFSALLHRLDPEILISDRECLFAKQPALNTNALGEIVLTLQDGEWSVTSALGGLYGSP
ncbi:MAG: ComEC/Rec2 family competence protein [Christensenellaceae bacterium]|nr:ComEC/Rec2 family competence protein [Christensenellaceae bacterium]